jgi:NADH dehydrogenase
VELGDEFAVDEIMGMKISGLMAALLWRLTYLYKLQSPRSKALIATDWIFGLFFKPVAAEIRRDE